MTAIAGSWIGGAANQAAMKEVFEIEPNIFGVMVAVDVLFAYLWMAVLLWMAANHQRLDRRLNADTTAINALSEKMERLRLEHERIPALADLMIMLALAFGATGLSHALAAPLAGAFTGVEWAERLSLASEFFWIVVLATTFGLLLSFTRARQLEGAGASRLGSALLYVLIATVGMQMNIGAVLTSPVLFGIGFTWIAFHAVVLLIVARLIKAPTFFLAVGSQANIGGAASAPVVAAAFHPSLAPVGVLLAVLGYALGTYGGWLSRTADAAPQPVAGERVGNRAAGNAGRTVRIDSRVRQRRESGVPVMYQLSIALFAIAAVAGLTMAVMHLRGTTRRRPCSRCCMDCLPHRDWSFCCWHSSRPGSVANPVSRSGCWQPPRSVDSYCSVRTRSRSAFPPGWSSVMPYWRSRAS